MTPGCESIARVVLSSKFVVSSVHFVVTAGLGFRRVQNEEKLG